MKSKYDKNRNYSFNLLCILVKCCRYLPFTNTIPNIPYGSHHAGKYNPVTKMADSASELESDTSSIDGGSSNKMPSPGQLEQLQKRIESLQQENRVLKMELDTYKLRCKTLQEENRELRRASVTIVSVVIMLTCHLAFACEL